MTASTVTITPLDCGELGAPRAMFESGGGDAPTTVPVPAWLIRHPAGLVLFDTGMHRELLDEGPLRETVSLFFELGLSPAHLVDARLRAVDVDPADIDVVVLSHLHFDHAGGLSLVPDARVVIQRTEWAAGVDDELAAANSFRRDDYDLGHDRIEISGEHDLFGDDRVVCVPTPGHTPGHQSLKVELDSGTVVLCADCAYFSHTLEGGPLPDLGHDLDQQRASLERLRDLGHRGAHLIPGHDRAVMNALPAELH